MAILTAKDAIKLELPRDLNDSLIVRCVEKPAFAPNSKGDPMITSKWEILGVPLEDGTIQDHIMRGSQKFVVAGIGCQKHYQTLNKKSLYWYKLFWRLAHGLSEAEAEEKFEVDTENPDLSYYPQLVMSAKCVAEVIEKRQKLSEQEIKERKEAGEEYPQGEVILGENGKPDTFVMAKIDTWNRRFEGELPVF